MPSRATRIGRARARAFSSYTKATRGVSSTSATAKAARAKRSAALKRAAKIK